MSVTPTHSNEVMTRRGDAQTNRIEIETSANRRQTVLTRIITESISGANRLQKAPWLAQFSLTKEKKKLARRMGEMTFRRTNFVSMRKQTQP